MIFVTIGTQLAFPRLINCIKTLIEKNVINEEVIFQYNEEPTDQTVNILSPEEFEKIIKRARIVIAHAGMGTILSCKELKKTLIIMPRKADLGEHRNDHQIDTCRSLEKKDYVHIAWNCEELEKLLIQNDFKNTKSSISASEDDLSNYLHEKTKEFLGESY